MSQSITNSLLTPLPASATEPTAIGPPAASAGDEPFRKQFDRANGVGESKPHRDASKRETDEVDEPATTVADSASRDHEEDATDGSATVNPDDDSQESADDPDGAEVVVEGTGATKSGDAKPLPQEFSAGSIAVAADLPDGQQQQVADTAARQPDVAASTQAEVSPDALESETAASAPQAGDGATTPVDTSSADEENQAAGQPRANPVEAPQSEAAAAGESASAPQTGIDAQNVSATQEGPIAGAANREQADKTDKGTGGTSASQVNPSAAEPAEVVPELRGAGGAEAQPETNSPARESAPQADASLKVANETTAPTTEGNSLTDRAGRLLNGNDVREADAARPVRVDAARFVSRVSKAFQSAQDNGGTVRLRLSPPELGSLRIELSLQQGAISARMEAETAAARTALLDNLPALRERLAEQQIRVDQFHVDVGGGQHDGPPDWEAARESAERRANQLPQTPTIADQANSQSPTPDTVTSGDGRFNAVA